MNDNNEEKENSENNNVNDNENDNEQNEKYDDKEENENINDYEEKENNEYNEENKNINIYQEKEVNKEEYTEQNDNAQYKKFDKNEIENVNFNINANNSNGKKQNKRSNSNNEKVNNIQLEIQQNKNNKENAYNNNLNEEGNRILKNEEMEKGFQNEYENDIESKSKVTTTYHSNLVKKNKLQRESKKKPIPKKLIPENKNTYSKMPLNQKSQNNQNLKNRKFKRTSKRHSSYSRETKYDYKFQNKYDLFDNKDKKFISQKIRSKPKERHLLSKTEQFNNRNSYKSNITYNYENLYKNYREIFPTLVGSDIPYNNNANLNLISIINNNDDNKKKDNNKKYNNNKKYEVKNYYSYQNNNVKSSNPFEGPSLYEKIHKERKILIAQVVKKEENDFSEISNIEQAIYNKKHINKEELNQLIYYFIDILYKDVDKILNNKEGLLSYNYKINKIAKIILFMDNVDHIKVMEALKRTADSHNKMELYERLSNEIESINKMRKSKLYKSESFTNGNREGYTFKAQIRKSLKNSIK